MRTRAVAITLNNRRRDTIATVDAIFQYHIGVTPFFPRSGKFLLLLALGLAFLPRSGWAQTKLYLKDGSFQLVKSYQIQGDRVRYYSVERSEWEEVPLALVDFAATKRAAAEKKEQQTKVLQEAKKAGEAAYQLPPNAGFKVAPGVRLPAEEGVYAYSGTRVITLIQTQSSLVQDKKRAVLNLAVPAPILKKRSLVVLPGPAAAVRIVNSSPVFYAHFADQTGANLELLRLKQRKNDREVEDVEAGLRGKLSESRSALPLDRQQIAPGLFRLKPRQPLTPGEYALGEVDQNKLNLDLWDFGIDSPGSVSHRQ